jgi:hypothetical protein
MSLNYEAVKAKLDSMGVITEFLKKETEECLLEISDTILKKMGFEVNEGEILLISRVNTELSFYFIDKNLNSNIGYGDESSIYPGKNLKTGVPVALKNGEYNSSTYRGWKIAFEHLNAHPNFVRTYAIGRIYQLNDELGVLNIQARTSWWSKDHLRAYQVMERIMGTPKYPDRAETVSSLDMAAKNWTITQINDFMKQILDAYDMFIKFGIGGFDDNMGNILVDPNYIPKLCDLNQLEYMAISANNLYYSATKPLYYIFRNARYPLNPLPEAEESSKRIEKKLDQLREWIKEARDMSRATVEKQFQSVIVDCLNDRCLVDCSQALQFKKIDDSNKAKIPNSEDSTQVSLVFAGKEIKEKLDCPIACTAYMENAREHTKIDTSITRTTATPSHESQVPCVNSLGSLGACAAELKLTADNKMFSEYMSIDTDRTDYLLSIAKMNTTSLNPLTLAFNHFTAMLPAIGVQQLLNTTLVSGALPAAGSNFTIPEPDIHHSDDTSLPHIAVVGIAAVGVGVGFWLYNKFLRKKDEEMPYPAKHQMKKK